MEILSPKVINHPNGGIILSHTGSFEYTDPVLKIPMTKSITTLTFGQMGINPQSVEFGTTAATDERVILFGGMQALIKSCVDNAEDIKNRILEIALERTRPANEEERIKFMRTDFMNLKQWFMDDIRGSKIYQEFKVYNSTKKLKPFSKAFNTFILDRNKYTHGQLCFISPNYDFAIEYIETPSQPKRYAKIDTDILISYNQCYKEIKELITEYTLIHQERILGFRK